MQNKTCIKFDLAEYAMAGIAGVCACCFTNPLEVAKVRMQLQGELVARGHHTIHYRNVLHAGYVIAKHDGLLALQAGLLPACCFQIALNGIRLGSYQVIDNSGLIRNDRGGINIVRNMIASGVCGGVGAFVGSPFYLIKTQLQAKAAKEIAVGYQHAHTGMMKALKTIGGEAGIRGLFRGASSAIPRACIGSMAQLTSFAYCKDMLAKCNAFGNRPLAITIVSSMIGGVVTALAMNPFDFISTRLYNQGIGTNGRGLLYHGYFDCISKIYRSEGMLAFYKGVGACYFRIGPHTVLTLVFWDALKSTYQVECETSAI